MLGLISNILTYIDSVQLNVGKVFLKDSCTVVHQRRGVTRCTNRSTRKCVKTSYLVVGNGLQDRGKK